MTCVQVDHEIRVETGLNSTLLCLLCATILSALHATIEIVEANLVTTIEH